MIRYSTGSGFTPLPEGIFDLRVDGVEEGVSKANNPQLKLLCQVIGGDDAESLGRDITIFYSLQPQATFRIGQVADALALEKIDTGEVDAKGEPIYTFDEQTMIGRVVRFTVSQRDYQGKKQNDYNSPEISPEDPYYAEVTAERAEAGGEGASNGAPAQSTPAQQPAAAAGPAGRRAARR
jgi:hypothetical protein